MPILLIGIMGLSVLVLGVNLVLLLDNIMFSCLFVLIIISVTTIVTIQNERTIIAITQLLEEITK